MKLEEPVSLRPAVLSDADEITQIEASVQVLPWTFSQVQDEIESQLGQTWVLTDDETDEKVVGFLSFREVEDEIHLINLAVHPNYQRKGVGLFLVQRLIDWAVKRSKKRVRLEVRVSNLSAVELYQQNQFSIVRVLRKFYTNGDDAYEMLNEMEDRAEF